jgi:hypothetical protein
LFFERYVADVQQRGHELDDGAELCILNAHHTHAVGCVRERVCISDVGGRVAAKDNYEENG